MRANNTHRNSRDESTFRKSARRVRAAAVVESLESRRLLAGIASGQTIASSISPKTEVESWTFNATAGGSIVVSVGDTSGNAFYPLVELFAPNGTRLTYASGQAGAAVGSYALAASGTYKATVKDYYAKTTGNYNITVASVGGAQQTGTDAGPILSGQTKSATINAGDLDVFTFAGTAGGSAILNVGDTSGNAFYPLIELFAPNGTRLTYASGQAGTAVANYALPTTGTYYAVVRDYYAATVGNYNITLASLAGTQQTGGDAGPISSGQTRAATASAGDLDVYTFQGTVGGSAIVSVGDTSGNAFYPLIELFSPTGKRLTYASGQAGTVVGSYALPQTGTYYAVVRDYYANTVGNYNITLASIAGTQQTGGDAGPIGSGQTKSGNLGVGDLDVFTFNGTAGGSAEVSVADTSGNALYPLIELFGPTGTRLTYASGQIGTSVGNYALPTTGTYYAVVRDYYANTSGNYNITAVSVPGTQDAGGDAGFLPSGITRNAKITAGDRDVHPFYAVTGDKIALTTSETGVATAFYPLVEFFDPTGKRLTYASGQVTANLPTLTAAKTGVYYYVVADYYSVTPGSYSTKLVETPSATKPTISVAATKDATEAGQVGTFVISRTNIRALPVTVTFTIGGTAKNGTDYTAITTTAIIPANAGSITIQVKPINDTADEVDETVTLTLASGAAYNLDAAKKSATLKVIDNDPTPASAPSAFYPIAATARPSAWNAFMRDDDESDIV